MRRSLAGVAVAAVLGATPAALAFDPAAALPGEAALSPLRRGAAVERHTPDTLWERIDGEAELYRAYGLTASAHAGYEDPANADRRVEVSAFVFADPLGAFGVFAAFRPPDCPGDGPAGNGGCLGDYQGFFWHGNVFLLADAAGPEATRSADVRRTLESAAALLGPPPSPPGPLLDFARLAEPRTIRYQPQHLLGREALPPGLEGTASGIPVFVAVAPGGARAATASLDAYARTLEDAVRGARGGREVLTGRDPALGPVVLLAGERALAGARSAPDAARLFDLLAQLAGGDGGGPAERTR